VIGLQDAIDRLRASSPQMAKAMDAFLPITDTPVEYEKSKREVQARLTEIIHDEKYTNFVAELTAEDSPESRERLAALLSAGKSGGAWLEASPALPYYRLSDEELALALAMRLGVPLIKPCACTQCGQQMDIYGRHAFVNHTCMNGKATNRHKKVNVALAHTFRDAGITVAVETLYESHYERMPESSQPTVDHRIDIHAEGSGDGGLDPVSGAPQLVIDTSVTHAGTHPLAHKIPLAAAKARVAEKLKFIMKHYKVSKDAIIIFVLETHGALGDEAMKLLHRIAEKKGGGKNEVSAQFLRFSLARIGVALQRGNAVILRHWRSACVPTGNRIVM